MAFRMEPQPHVEANDQIVRLYKATCVECDTIVASNANAAKCQSARRDHKCGGKP